MVDHSINNKNVQPISNNSTCNVTALPVGNYSEQITVATTSNVLGLEYNITAVPQNSSATEYGYLLNGKTSNGYWYQFGLGFYPKATENNKFKIVVQIWKNSTPLTPSLNFSLQIKNNDKISLLLIPSYNATIMEAIDRNTNARIVLCANSTGIKSCNVNNAYFSNQSFFAGGLNNTFTGLMVEVQDINGKFNGNITNQVSFDPINWHLINVKNNSVVKTPYQNINFNTSVLSIDLFKFTKSLTPEPICPPVIALHKNSSVGEVSYSRLNVSETLFTNGTFIVK